MGVFVIEQIAGGELAALGHLLPLLGPLGDRLARLLIRRLGVLRRRGILVPVFQHLVAAVLRPAARKGSNGEGGKAQHSTSASIIDRMRRLDFLMAGVPLSHRRTLRLDGRSDAGGVNKRGKLVRVQAHVPHKANDVQVFQLGALLCQFLLP